MLYMKFPLYTKYVFFKMPGKTGDSFNFSSEIDKVGTEWDVSIQNGTGVDVISAPVTVDHPKYGIISLVKIKADVATDYHTIIKEFWVPTDCIIKVEENNESQSSQLLH